MPKKSTSKKTQRKAVKVTPTVSRKSVDIRRASNGFVVSSYTDKGEKLLIAKTAREAKTFANKLLGI